MIFGKWFFRTYWIVPLVFGVLFNTVAHTPQLWSIGMWTAVTGCCIVLAVVLGEWSKPMVVAGKPE